MDFLRKKNPKVSLHQYRVFSTVKEKSETFTCSWLSTKALAIVSISSFSMISPWTIRCWSSWNAFNFRSSCLAHLRIEIPSVWSVSPPLWVGNFPNSGRQKMEQPVEVCLHIYCVGKWKIHSWPDFQKGKIGYLETIRSCSLLSDPAPIIPEARSPRPWLSPFFAPCLLRHFAHSTLSYPLLQKVPIEITKIGVGSWIWIIF